MLGGLVMGELTLAACLDRQQEARKETTRVDADAKLTHVPKQDCPHLQPLVTNADSAAIITAGVWLSAAV